MSKIRRSVYQKLAEENKRLQQDIRILIEGKVFDFIKVKKKWKNQFDQERIFNSMMKDIAKEYFETDPVGMKLKKEFDQALNKES